MTGYRDRCPACGAESPPFPDRNDERLAVWLVMNGWRWHKGIWLCKRCHSAATKPRQKPKAKRVKQEVMW